MPTNKQNHHKKVIDQLPFGYAYHKIIRDEKGTPIDYAFLDINPVFEQLTGKTLTEISGRPESEVIPGIKSETFNWIEFYGEVALNGQSKTTEQFSEALNRWYRIFASSLETDHFFTVFTDITSEKLYASKLQESEEKFAVAFHKAPFTMALTDVNTGRIEEVNDAFAKILGYTRKELIGKQTVDLGLWANPNDRDAVLKELMEGRSVFEKEIPIRKKTGEIINGLFSASIIQINNKPYILSTNEDITVRRKNEQALRESEEKFFNAFRLSPNTMTISEIESGNLIDVNNAFVKDSGYSKEEALSSSTISLDLWVNEKDREQVINELKIGNTIMNREYKFKKKDGSIIYGSFSANIIKVRNKPFILSSIANITQSKITEQALRESEEKFARAFQLAPFSITLTDGQTEQIVEVNEAFTKSTGYSRKEVLNKSSASLHLWAKEEDRKQVISDLLQGKPVLCREYEFVNKDGSRVYGSFSATVIAINGRPYVLGSIEDITEKTLLRFKLDKELAFRQYLFDNSKDGYVLINNEYKLVDANAKFRQMTGYSSDHLTQRYFWEIDAMLTEQDMRNMFDPEEGFVSAYQTKHRNSEGVLYDVEVNAWGFLWKGEKIIFCTCRDISAQKFKTNKLLGIERRYENLLEYLNGVLFELASDGTILYISSLINEMAGYETEECLNRHFSELFHPEDQPLLMHDFEQLQQGIEYPSDYRAMTKNGEVIWVRCMAKRAEETASQVRYRGVVQNITQLKETEAKLREAEQKLSALLDG